ncbi:MAG: hypothetical protein ACOVNU_14735 [Candidatus Kapaibacteriota bacterium]
MMRLNVINNYKTIYYNFLASFYLCLNCVLPYYDDVIISLQSQAIKLLIDNDALNMKKVKKIRMIEFIDSLDKSDKIILDKEKDIILIDYCIYECHDDSNGAESTSSASGPETETDSNTNEAGAKDSEKTSSDSDPDKDPYEPRKKKSRIDNDYIPQPAGPMKDKDDYYNMGVYAVSATAATAAAAATAANNAAKYLIEDSGSNSADTTDTADTADTDEDGLDKEIDVSIRNIIQHIIYDKNKDD